MSEFVITEPVTLAEAKAHLRVYHSQEDAYITSLIPVAREYAEDFVNAKLIARSSEDEEGTDYRAPKAKEKQAMLLIIGDLYQNRENSAAQQSYQISLSAQHLLWFNREVPV